jgi:predicted signal transduction protein with EAL and GGDEF domain
MVESVLGGQLAHVAADEFAFVVVDMKGTQGQVEFGEAVRRRIEEPLAIDHERIFITCSVGVSCFPDNGMTPQELLGQAEAAMLRAKFEGRNTVVAFANEQKQELEERRSLGLRLRDAIRDGQFVLHYQPQINGHDW